MSSIIYHVAAYCQFLIDNSESRNTSCCQIGHGEVVACKVLQNLDAKLNLSEDAKECILRGIDVGLGGENLSAPA